MTEVKWFKVQVGIFDNMKMKLIEAMPDGSALCCVWFKMLDLAAAVNDHGLIHISDDIPFTVDTLSVQFRYPVDIIAKALDAFQSLNMVEIEDGFWKISNWGKYQCADGLDRIKQKNNERQARFRAKRKTEETEDKKENNSNVTDNVTDNVTVTDSSISISISNSNSLSSKKESLKDKEIKDKEIEDMFNQFYSSYPKKQGKKLAKASFEKVMKEGKVEFDVLMDALDRQKVSADWIKENGKYIPMPSSWLNQERWEDEVKEYKEDRKATAGSRDAYADAIAHRMDVVDEWC